MSLRRAFCVSRVLGAPRVGGISLTCARHASVLVGVDGSECSKDALHKALNTVVQADDTLHIVYVPPVLGTFMASLLIARPCV